MSIPSPTAEPEIWDGVEVAGRKWPGLVEVDGCEQIFEWQKNKGKGSDGATVNYQGADLAEPKLTFRLWRGYDGGAWVDYFELWQEYKKVFSIPVSDKQPNAVTIVHPQFALAGIGAVVVKKIGDIKFKSEAGDDATVTVELLVYRKPKPAGGTPKAAAKDKSSWFSKKANQRPKTDIEIELEKTNAENADLADKILSKGKYAGQPI